MLDQHRLIHAVEPILGANPGRLLIYIPIIPLGYIQRWFTFEGKPWKIYFGKKHVPVKEKLGALVQNTYRNLTRRNKAHHSRSLFSHKTLDLP